MGGKQQQPQQQRRRRQQQQKHTNKQIRAATSRKTTKTVRVTLVNIGKSSHVVCGFLMPLLISFEQKQALLTTTTTTPSTTTTTTNRYQSVLHVAQLCSVMINTCTFYTLFVASKNDIVDTWLCFRQAIVELLWWKYNTGSQFTWDTGNISWNMIWHPVHCACL